MQTDSKRYVFNKTVSRLLERDLGKTICDQNREELIELVVLLGLLFHVSMPELVGDPKAEAECWRLGLARLYVAAAGPKGESNSGINPRSFIFGLKQASKECRSFPSYGLLASLACGESVQGYPGGMLKGQSDARRHPPTSVQEYGDQMAGVWENESRDLGIHPDQMVPVEVAKRRAAELQKILSVQLW